jgi:hypothetical protein
VRPEPETDYEPWLIGEQALAAAIQRIAATPEETPELEIAAIEAVWWCAALHDWHKRRVGNDTAYYEFQRSRPEGQAVEGLMYARNAAIHELALFPGFVDAGEPLQPFREESDGLWVGLQQIEVRWRQASTVPGFAAPADRHGKDAFYERHVAGRPLTEPLRTALTFFREVVWEI